MQGYITRPFHCACHENHVHATHYIVYGGRQKTMLYYPIQQEIIDNITPHIVSYKSDEEKNKVNIAISCGVVGCGLRLNNPDKVSEGFVYLDIRKMTLPKNEFKALINFKHTGFELHKRYYRQPIKFLR